MYYVFEDRHPFVLSHYDYANTHSVQVSTHRLMQYFSSFKSPMMTFQMSNMLHEITYS